MDFIKSHGTGNDFVVFEDLADRLVLSPTLVRAIADRHRGVGADGVIRVAPARRNGNVFMDYRNADGSVVETCGNGLRVVAKYIVDHGLATPDVDGWLRVETRAGISPIRVRRGHDGLVAEVEVDMGLPLTDPDQVPFLTPDTDRELHELAVGGRSVNVAVVSMGNPHAVLTVADVDDAPVTTLGPAIETHERFPKKVNVGFAEIVDSRSLRLRVWERGVGETLACGTGACAAVVALQRQGSLEDTVAVTLPGGTLRISHEPGQTVKMTGPAVEVASGRLDRAWLEAVGSTEGEV